KLLLQLAPHLLDVEVPQPRPRRRLDRLDRLRRSSLGLRLGGSLSFFGRFLLLLLLLALGLLWLLLLFLLFVFFVCHGVPAYLTLGIGWPDFTAIRSSFPSLSRRRRTRVGAPDFGSS